MITLRFRATKAPAPLADIATFLRTRPGYRVDDQAATYWNEETGVGFVLRIEVAQGEVLPLALDVPVDGPAGFALEIEGETRALVERFSLAISDGERLGISGGVYDKASFLAAWNRASTRAHATRVATEEEIPQHLPTWTLEHTWRWNFGRAPFERHLAASGGVHVPGITYHPSPAGGRRLITAVLWAPPQPIVLPEVDVVRIATPGNPIRHLDLAALQVALGDVLFAPASDMAPMRHLAITSDTVGDAGLAALLQAAAPGDVEAAVASATVAIEERVADAVVLPRLRAVADGADAGDLEFTLFSTSAHRTFTTTIRGGGAVVKGEIFVPGEEAVGSVPVAEVRALAKVVASTDFPHLRLPPGHPPPPPTVPDVRVTIRAGGLGLSVEMPASETDAVPDFAAILGKIATVAAHAEQEAKTDPSPALAPVPSAAGAPASPAAAVLRALEQIDAPGSTRTIVEHEYRVLWLGQTLATETNERGEPLAAVFTADDRIDAYLAKHGLSRGQVAVSTIAGQLLFSQIGAYQVAGFDFDPGSPGQRVFPLSLATRVLAPQ